LGGWKVHADITGFADMVVETDEEALSAIKTFLSYMPAHNREAPPIRPVPAKSGSKMAGIAKLLPAKRTQVYDVRTIIRTIVDADSFFELKPRFGKVAVTGLARLDGRTVGLVANNPLFKGGAMDTDACEKVTSFLVLCDSFNIPLVFLVDQPGFLIGLEGERRGAPGKIINWMNARSLVTVPKITVIMRKSYGQAYLNMGGGKNSDEVICWPMADLGFMAPEVSVNVLHGLKREDDPARYDELLQDVARDTSAWSLAALYEAHMVIDPRETRDSLIALLDVHRSRLGTEVGKHLLSSWPTSY
jgi:acetyl-CoA carboxylase carboxyltransferase component